MKGTCRLVVFAVVLFGLTQGGCGVSQSQIKFAEAQPRQVKYEKIELYQPDSLEKLQYQNLLALCETTEMWACFGPPDEYTNEKQTRAVITYRYQGRPSFEIVRELKAVTEKRDVVYLTEAATEGQKAEYVIRVTGRGCKHYYFRRIGTPPEEIAWLLDDILKKRKQ